MGLQKDAETYPFYHISCLKMCPGCTDVALQLQVSYNIEHSATSPMIAVKHFMVNNRASYHQQIAGVISVDGVFFTRLSNLTLQNL